VLRPPQPWSAWPAPDAGHCLKRNSPCFWPYSQEDLENAEHIHELPRNKNLTLNIDYKQRGVGGDAPGIPTVHDKYKLKKNTLYNYSFKITPITD